MKKKKNFNFSITTHASNFSPSSHQNFLKIFSNILSWLKRNKNSGVFPRLNLTFFYFFQPWKEIEGLNLTLILLQLPFAV